MRLGRSTDNRSTNVLPDRVNRNRSRAVKNRVTLARFGMHRMRMRRFSHSQQEVDAMPACTETAWNGLRLFAEEAGTLEQPEDRIRAVLGVSDGPLPEVGNETLQSYYDYLTDPSILPISSPLPRADWSSRRDHPNRDGGWHTRSDEEPGLRISWHCLQSSPGETDGRAFAGGPGSGGG